MKQSMKQFVRRSNISEKAAIHKHKTCASRDKCVLEPFLGSYILWGCGVYCLSFVVHLLVSGAQLVVVTVSSAARAGSAAMPPPPLPGA